MLEPSKITISAKLSKPLHDLLAQAVEDKQYKDKTDCITQALEKLLSNTHQEPLFNPEVIHERDKEIHRLTQELRATQTKLDELQRITKELPDPLELAVLRAQDEGLRALIEEKERTIEILLREVSRFERIEFSQSHGIQEVSNTQVIQRNSKRISWKESIQKFCLNCNTEFETRNQRKVFCSGKCKTAYYRRNVK